MEHSGYSDWVQLDRLGSLVGIDTGYGWTVWGEYWLQRLATGGRSVERSGHSDRLMVNGQWSVEFIATD